MRRLRLMLLASCLAAAAVSAEAGEVRLGDAELDAVTAGIMVPRSPLLAQMPGILAANNIGWMLLVVQPLAEASQNGGPLRSLFGYRLPFALPLGGGVR